MRSTLFVFSIAIASLFSMLPAQAAKETHCSLTRYAELPVTMAGTRPLVAGSINGVNALFLIDSGAPYSVLAREAADKFQLKLGARFLIAGTGGTTEARLTKAKDFSLGGLLDGKVFHNVEFAVNGTASIYGRGTDGLIGQNVFGKADMEFDLANGVVRLYVEKDCGSQSLAYWHGDAAVAVMDTKRLDAAGHHIVGDATLNGAKIRVIFDSGAGRSILTLQAAARAGIKPDQENVSAAGLGHGIGNKAQENSIARFKILDLGGEKIENARLGIGDIAISSVGDMLLGADFFLSHRIYVSGRQNKVYFTYNGGRVFDIGAAEKPKQTVASAASEPSDAAKADTPKADAAKVEETRDPLAPKDAAGFRRRGAAFAARMELANAIADFDQAVKLEPDDPENYYQRGMAKLQNRQGRLALFDFDQTLKLKPDHLLALIERGSIKLAMKNDSEARADFDAAINLAPTDPGLPLRVAQIYLSNRHYDEVINRLDQWIAKFPKEDRIVGALDGRCRARTMLGKQLDLALEDCNAALKKGVRNSELLDSRGLVYLRRGDFDKAMTDFKASLKLQPKSAMTLYGLGIAELKKGATAEGGKNIQAATAIAANIAEFYKRLSLNP